MYISKELSITDKSKSELETELEKLNFDKFDGYSYLIGMPLYSLTTDKIKELETSIEKLKKEIETVTKTSIEQMWRKDLK